MMMRPSGDGDRGRRGGGMGWGSRRWRHLAVDRLSEGVRAVQPTPCLSLPIVDVIFRAAARRCCHLNANPLSNADYMTQTSDDDRGNASHFWETPDERRFKRRRVKPCKRTCPPLCISATACARLSMPWAYLDELDRTTRRSGRRTGRRQPTSHHPASQRPPLGRLATQPHTSFLRRPPGRFTTEALFSYNNKHIHSTFYIKGAWWNGILVTTNYTLRGVSMRWNDGFEVEN